MFKNKHNKNIIILITILVTMAFLLPDINADIKNENNIIFYPTDDTKIRMKSPDDNYGAAEVMNVRNRYGSSSHPYYWEHDVLIKFDLSSIPEGSNILSAELFLYYFNYNDNNPVGHDLTLYRVTSDWNEETVTWNTRPNIVDNFTAYSIVPSSYDWMIWNVTDDVLDFINNIEINHGWQLMDENYWGSVNIPWIDFRTKEYGDFIPYLKVKVDDNSLPEALFFYKPLNPTTKEVVNFNDRSSDLDGNIVSWWWNFGNGFFSDLQNPAFQYHKAGTYTVKITVTDNDGASDSYEREIIILDPII